MNYEAIAVWSQVAGSVLFIVVLVWLFNKFMIPAVVAAAKAKNEEIALAERRRDDMKAHVELLRGSLGAAQKDAQAIKARAIDQAQHERERALEESRLAGERQVRSADGELERARAAARESFRNELLEKALGAARSQAASRVDAGTNSRLVDQFLHSLERGGLN